MGCPISTESKASSDSPDMTNYKKRLEHKLCWSRETPEDTFDVSECRLSEVPAGIFCICAVLRKRQLLLQENRLTSLKGGGQLPELNLLTVLNLSGNLFKRLPDDICRLENLRELIVARNCLVNLPSGLHRLRYLELLDLSYNRLANIASIAMMERLRILNVAGNKITQLPKMLATCEDLMDIIYDVEMVEDPPPEIGRGGTANVLKYLREGFVDVTLHEIGDVAPSTSREPVYRVNPKFEAFQEEQDRKRRDLLKELEVDHNLEAFQAEQNRQRLELLKKLQADQSEAETLVLQVQRHKDSEQHRLIGEIQREETATQRILDSLLCLKNGPDPAILEQERIEREHLLGKLMDHQNDALRRQEVIAQMTNLLNEEMEAIRGFQDERDATSRSILERERQSTVVLSELFGNYDKSRGVILEQIVQDETMQKTAVASLLAKNDARSWGLMEQIRILEAELAKLTSLEQDKKRLQVNSNVNELGTRRLEISFLLMDLMAQQDKRKAELIATLAEMDEAAKCSPDFWLLQYQKLLDQQPVELNAANAIEPQLGCEFLKAGVVHCLPFLARILLDETQLHDMSDEKLLSAGIRNETDRLNLLQAIKNYLYAEQDATEPPSAPDVTSECVICLDRAVKVLFFPCGHLCCCIECQPALEECPLCRSSIERRIKVIQS